MSSESTTIKRVRLSPIVTCINECIQRRVEREGISANVLGEELLTLEDPYVIMAYLVHCFYGNDAAPVVQMKEEPISKELLFSCTMYTCGKCKAKQTRYVEKQTRSSDEAATQFIECSCGHTWKRN
jgi:hypothetical protein